jgi:hypothetical protein
MRLPAISARELLFIVSGCATSLLP